MTALYNKGLKWFVRDGAREWEFQSWEEAQLKMTQLTRYKRPTL